MDLSSAAATCSNVYFFPSGCAAAWRLRFEIPAAMQTPGTYLLSSEDSPPDIFVYLDGQGPGPGTACANLGMDYAATLIITEIDGAHISGTVCGDAQVQGSFTASFCPAKG